MKEKCKDCYYWYHFSVAYLGKKIAIGECKRHSPSNDKYHPFPIVVEDNGCGDWKEKKEG